MTPPTGIALDRTLELTYSNSVVEYSSRLVRTRADFYDTLKQVATMAVATEKTLTLPTAAEEQALFALTSKGAETLASVEELKDYFGRNDEGWYAWGHTLTGIRIPETFVARPCKIGDRIPVLVIVTDTSSYVGQIADSRFTRENWKDIIEDVNKIVGELTMPYSEGQVITEMDPKFGIFTEIDAKNDHCAPYALHGWLRKNLEVPIDPISGYRDLSVGRGGYWHSAAAKKCLEVVAGCGRLSTIKSGARRTVMFPAPCGGGPGGGFRPVVRQLGMSAQ